MIQKARRGAPREDRGAPNASSTAKGRSHVSFRLGAEDEARLAQLSERSQTYTSEVVRGALALLFRLPEPEFSRLLAEPEPSTERFTIVGRASLSEEQAKQLRDLRRRGFMLGHEPTLSELVRKGLRLLAAMERDNLAEVLNP